MRIPKAVCLLFGTLFPFLPFYALYGGEEHDWRVIAEKEQSRTPQYVHLEKKVRNEPTGRRANLQLLLLAPGESASLRVVDLVPLEDRLSVAEGLAKNGALAGVNGSYFHPDFTPLGLVVSRGKELHRLERAKLLSGLLTVTPQGAQIQRVGEFRPSKALREAIQAGPFLVDRGRPVPGLNNAKSAERTVVLADRQGVTGFLVTSPLTLKELGHLLATPGLFKETTVYRALNLDGGSSSALWISESGYSFRERKRVRNAIGLFPPKNR